MKTVVKAEQVDHPAHYNSGDIECIDALRACSTPEEFVGWLRLSIMKYMWRARHKNGVEDLAKAQWYLNYLKQYLLSNENAPLFAPDAKLAASPSIFTEPVAPR